jgi:hypothetical protein
VRGVRHGVCPPWPKQAMSGNARAPLYQ